MSEDGPMSSETPVTGARKFAIDVAGEASKAVRQVGGVMGEAASKALKIEGANDYRGMSEYEKLRRKAEQGLATPEEQNRLKGIGEDAQKYGLGDIVEHAVERVMLDSFSGGRKFSDKDIKNEKEKILQACNERILFRGISGGPELIQWARFQLKRLEGSAKGNTEVAGFDRATKINSKTESDIVTCYEWRISQRDAEHALNNSDGKLAPEQEAKRIATRQKLIKEARDNGVFDELDQELSGNINTILEQWTGLGDQPPIELVDRAYQDLKGKIDAEGWKYGRYEEIVDAWVAGVDRNIEIAKLEARRDSRHGRFNADDLNKLEEQQKYLGIKTLKGPKKRVLQEIAEASIVWERKRGGGVSNETGRPTDNQQSQPQLETQPDIDDSDPLLKKLRTMLGGSGMDTRTSSWEFRQSSAGVTTEDAAMLKSGTAVEVKAWFRERIEETEDPVMAQSAQTQVGFALDYMKEFRGKTDRIFRESGEFWVDRIVFGKFFSAFNEAGGGRGKGFGEGGEILRKLASDAFEGKDGTERLTRLWRESWSVINAMEGNRDRMRRYLNAETIEENDRVLSEMSGELRLSVAEVKFGIRMWRATGRQALMDAYIGKNTGEFNGIRRLNTEDKQLAKIMRYDLFAHKNHVGANEHLQQRGDTEFRDLFSFMFSDEDLRNLGLGRNQHFIVPDLSRGNRNALANLDFTKLPKGGQIFSEWLGAAEKADSTAVALSEWMKKPDSVNVAKLRGAYLHLITAAAYSKVVEGQSWALIEENRKVTKKEAKLFGTRRALNWYEIASTTYEYYTSNKFGIDRHLRIDDPLARERFAQSLFIGPTSEGEDRKMEEKMLAMVGVSKKKQVFRGVTSNLINVAKAVGSTILGLGGK